MKSSDCVIAGAGPVGLLLANLLGQRNIRTVVIEKRPSFSKRSMAIGITPPSLAILNQLGLDRVFIANGVKIHRAFIFGSRHYIGNVGFDCLNSEYPFILSLPQARTTQLLFRALQQYPSVVCRLSTELTDYQIFDDHVLVHVGDRRPNPTKEIRTRYLIGCDGINSRVRELSEINIRSHDYRVSFRMADFDDDTSFGNDAYLFFTLHGAVESFPIPGRQRRWIIQTEKHPRSCNPTLITRKVRQRTGVDLSGSTKYHESPFQVRWMLTETYSNGRVVLCGDAGHEMSPIGGQGMNTGFADAEFLANAFEYILHKPESAGYWLERYDYLRRQAFLAAASRAARGMWLGTRTGKLRSLLRNGILKILLTKPMANWIARQFSMLTIPYSTFNRFSATPYSNP